jgi:hypothetical protein
MARTVVSSSFHIPGIRDVMTRYAVEASPSSKHDVIHPQLVAFASVYLTASGSLHSSSALLVLVVTSPYPGPDDLRPTCTSTRPRPPPDAYSFRRTLSPPYHKHNPRTRGRLPFPQRQRDAKLERLGLRTTSPEGGDALCFRPFRNEGEDLPGIMRLVEQELSEP